MKKLFKKIQQDYIAAKIKNDPTTRIAWAKTEEGVLLTVGGCSLYHIPAALVFVKLEERQEAPMLKRYTEHPDDYKPAIYKGRLQGYDLFGAEEGSNTFLRSKEAAPFLGVKGVNWWLCKDPRQPVRFCSADGKFLGVVMPTRKKEGQHETD